MRTSRYSFAMEEHLPRTIDFAGRKLEISDLKWSPGPADAQNSGMPGVAPETLGDGGTISFLCREELKVGDVFILDSMIPSRKSAEVYMSLPYNDLFRIAATVKF